MKSKIPFLIFCVLLFSLLYSFFTNLVFLPVDILKGLPLFGLDPSGIHNSLLADPVFQFEPWRIFMKESFTHGHLPFWNELNGNGVPFLANPITSVFFPLNLLYVLFPPKFSLLIMALIKIVIFCFGVYFYLRKVNISKEMALLGSVISTSGYFILWLDWPQTNVYIFFPFVLLFVEKLYEKISFSNLAVFSLIFFLAFLGGHPETYFQLALVGFLYGVIKYPKSWKNHMFYCLSIVIGTLLAGFQLFPFLEYLYYSYALHARSITPHAGLSLESFVFNFFPYVLGAPHLKFYKPFPGTNFQEATGGYVGIIFFTLIFIKFKSVFTSSLQKTWLIISIISIVLAYSIPVVSDVIKLTPLGINANSRMIATLGFGVLVLGVSILDTIYKSKSTGKIKLKFHIPILTILLLCLIAIQTRFSDFLLAGFGQTQSGFIQVLVIFVVISIVSSVCFFLTLPLRGKLPKNLFLFLLTLFVALQTLLLFGSYNTFEKKEFYYPNNRAIEVLKRSDLPMLNVGNVNLSPDINMAYGIKSIENYDAMDISWYKKYFDENFPDKNRWGNVDSVTFESLKKFGVGSVISDYNINNKKVSVQNKSKSVIPLNQKAIVNIYGNNKTLRQIRFLPATYNRSNDCLLSISLISVGKVIRKAIVSCEGLYNGMFYTVDVQPEILSSRQKYQVIFEKTGESIALFGEKNVPYLDLLFDSGYNYYQEAYRSGSVVIYKVPDVKTIETQAVVRNVKSSGGELSFIVVAKEPTKVLVKKTYFPGWTLTINGIKTQMLGKNPFMSFAVPKGESKIVLQYKPTIFYLGLLFSVVTFSTLLIVMIVHLSKNIRAAAFFSFLSAKAQEKSVSFHIGILSLAFLISVTFFLFLCSILTVKFTMPETTAINWLTVNNYPKQQDLFYFAVGFPFVTLLTILIWITTVCKKK